MYLWRTRFPFTWFFIAPVCPLKTAIKLATVLVGITRLTRSWKRNSYKKYNKTQQPVSLHALGRLRVFKPWRFVWEWFSHHQSPQDPPLVTCRLIRKGTPLYGLLYIGMCGPKVSGFLADCGYFSHKQCTISEVPTRAGLLIFTSQPRESVKLNRLQGWYYVKGRFETPTWQEPIKQDRDSGQLFRPY